MRIVITVVWEAPRGNSIISQGYRRIVIVEVYRGNDAFPLETHRWEDLPEWRRAWLLRHAFDPDNKLDSLRREISA